MKPAASGDLDLAHRLKRDRLHGSAVAFSQRGVLILGPSGSGKSSLALHLISLGADLVSDDQVMIIPTEHSVRLEPPPSLEGMVESRHIGILGLKTWSTARLELVVDLSHPTGDRLPVPKYATLNARRFDLICAANTPHLAATVRLLLTGAQLVRPE